MDYCLLEFIICYLKITKENQMNIDIRKSVLAVACAAGTWALVTALLNYLLLFLGSYLAPYLETNLMLLSLLNIVSEVLSTFISAYISVIAFIKVYDRSGR